jgi:hypothetical protein
MTFSFALTCHLGGKMWPCRRKESLSRRAALVLIGAPGLGLIGDRRPLARAPGRRCDAAVADRGRRVIGSGKSTLEAGLGRAIPQLRSPWRNERPAYRFADATAVSAPPLGREGSLALPCNSLE